MNYMQLRLIVDADDVLQSLGDIGQPQLKLLTLMLTVFQRLFLFGNPLPAHLYSKKKIQKNKTKYVHIFHVDMA